MNQLVRMILARAARDPAFREVVLHHPEQLLQDFPLTQQELGYLQQLSPGDLAGANPGPPDSPLDQVGRSPGPPNSPLDEVGLNPQPEPPSSPAMTTPGPPDSPGDMVGLNPQPEPPSSPAMVSPGPPNSPLDEIGVSPGPPDFDGGAPVQPMSGESPFGTDPELDLYDSPVEELMEEEGIFYSFQHEQSGHSMPVENTPPGGPDLPKPDMLGSVQPVEPAIAIPNLIEARKGSNEFDPGPDDIAVEPPSQEAKARMDGVVLLHSSLPGGSAPPEPDDEVLVAFEHGSRNRPLVIGVVFGGLLLLVGLVVIGLVVSGWLRRGDTEGAAGDPTAEPVIVEEDAVNAVEVETPFTPLPTGEPQVEPTAEGNTVGGSPGGTSASCGDGVCTTSAENSDLCPQDCQCADDGVCNPGEGANCQDCGSAAGACGAVCSNASQCAAGLACASGVCWDACTCGGDCGSQTDGGTGGGPVCGPADRICPSGCSAGRDPDCVGCPDRNADGLCD